MGKSFCIIFSIFTQTIGFSELLLPSVFSDHMVLQSGQPIPIWGTANPGAVITIDFAKQKKTVSADTEGKWHTDLSPMATSAESRVLEISSSADNQQIKINDVLVGEVWLCSGQSNMAMPLEGWPTKCPVKNSAADIAGANYPLIRLHQIPSSFSKLPQSSTASQWAVCTPETVTKFSACAYYFGRKLHQDLNVPVGLIQSAWGGTRIEPWTPPCGLEGFDSLADIRQKIRSIPPELGTDPEKKNQDRQYPTVIYNAMIHPCIPYAIRGVIWYQGEANRKDGLLYLDKSKALLKGWRTLWGYDFPFYFVQIAPYQYDDEDPAILPRFWEAQSAVNQQIPNTGMAVINDAGDISNIHPADKETPGTRLALLAEAGTYHMNVTGTGPVFQSLENPDGKLKVTFESTEGLTTRDGKAPNWFEIAGKDKIFKPAVAVIQGNSIILSSPDVPQPQAMRFAWSKLAQPNLINNTGLPVASFRAETVRDNP